MSHHLLIKLSHKFKIKINEKLNKKKRRRINERTNQKERSEVRNIKLIKWNSPSQINSTHHLHPNQNTHKKNEIDREID